MYTTAELSIFSDQFLKVNFVQTNSILSQSLDMSLSFGRNYFLSNLLINVYLSINIIISMLFIHSVIQDSNEQTRLLIHIRGCLAAITGFF